MQVHTFLAESVADAVVQIRETLGPEAIVLNVRRLPAEGLARLWQKPRIEVLAHIPEAAASSSANVAPAAVQSQTLDEVQLSALAELRAEMQEMRDSLQKPVVQPTPILPVATASVPTVSALPPVPQPIVPPLPAVVNEISFPQSTPAAAGDWRIGAILEQTGMSAVNAERVVADLCAQFGEAAPIALVEEIELAQKVLSARWKAAPNQVAGPHVFVGAPGAGKTTALCKWLAQVSLVEGRRAAVWRLDSHVANTAESLSVFAEILGVPVERCAPLNGEAPEVEVLFIDLPGVNPSDATGMAQLQQRLAAIPNAQVHLVLNAAYETALLLSQARAFAALPIADVVVTHLDEETRWGKLWNLVLGTNCSLRFLAAGQNIPGEFAPASAAALFHRQFPQKLKVLNIK